MSLVEKMVKNYIMVVFGKFGMECWTQVVVFVVMHLFCLGC